MSYSKLADFFVEKAARDLGENESTRQQALAEMRSWIENHPNIKRCRQDDLFLLLFLRARKFSIEKTKKNLKNFLTTPQNFPQYFNNLNVNDPTITSLVESGYYLVMPNRDEDGCKIGIYRLALLDTNRFTADDVIRFTVAIIEHLLIEEENQIAGAVNIIDLTDMPRSMLKFFSFSDFKNILFLLVNVLPFRMKVFYIMGLPKFAKQIFEWSIGFVNKKLRKRLVIVNDVEDLKNKVDIQLLPDIYGGKFAVPEAIMYLQENLPKNRDMILKFNDNEADFDKAPSISKNYQEENKTRVVVENFKKLDFD